MKNTRTMLAAAAAVAASVMLILAPSAGAAPDFDPTTDSPPEAHTVSWITPEDPLEMPPTDWDDAGHPQTLLSATGEVPICLPHPAWVQIDHYLVPKFQSDEYRALIRGGVLDEVDGLPADHKWVVSWSFELVTGCWSPDPDPTPTLTEPLPTPTETEPEPDPTETEPLPTATQFSTPPPAPSETTASAAPVPVVASATPTVEAPAPSAAPTAAPVATKPLAITPVSSESLANTGSDNGKLVLVGFVAFMGGLAMLVAVRRRS